MLKNKTRYWSTLSDAGAFAGILLSVLFCWSAIYGQSQLPDLVVSKALIQRAPVTAMAVKLTVTVVNTGIGSAGITYLLVTFRQSSEPNAKPVYYVGHPIRSLNAGESIVTTFDLKGKNISAGTTVFIEVDPYNKVIESDETNNSRTISVNQ